MANPIKYSDLVQPDSSITQLIEQLQELAKTYVAAQSQIVEKAKELRQSLVNVSGATEQGRTAAAQGAKEADELANAMQRLSKAQNENAETIAVLNTKLKEQTQLNALNARTLLSEDGSYNQLAATLTKLKLQYQQLGEAQRNSEQGDKLRSDIAQTSAAIKQYNEEVKEEIKLAEVRAKIRNAEKGSYNQLSAIYTGLKLKINAMGEADEKAVVAKRKLEEQAKAVYQQMIKLQEATGKHTLSVGNYAKSWDGLRFSVFQVVREVPNAAMSMQTFFLAISNNLPIVADEIARVKAENKALAEEGKKGVPVWKQLTSAVLSWQTVMIAGIFLLTKFGAQLVDWIGKLISGRNAVMSYSEAIDNMNKEIAENGSEFGRNMAAYKRLQAEWKNTSSEKERIKWIKIHKSELEQLTTKVKDVDSAEDFFVKNTANVIRGFELRAKAAAAMTLAQKEYEKAFKLQVENSRKTGTASDLEWWRRGLYNITGVSAYADIAAMIELRQAGEEMRGAMTNAQQYVNMFVALDNEANKILGDPHKGGGGGSNGHKNTGRDPRDITKDIEKMIRDVNQALSESATALMGSGINHTLAQIDDATQKGINKMEDIRGRIQHWLNNPKRFKLTDAQRESLEALKSLIDLTQGNLSAKGAIDATNARQAESARLASFDARMAKLAGESAIGLSLFANYAQRSEIMKAEQNAEIENLRNTYQLRADLIAKGDADELKRREEYLRELELLQKKHALQMSLLGVDYTNSSFAHGQRMQSLWWRISSANRTPSRRQQLGFTYRQNAARLSNELNDPNTTPERRAEIEAEQRALLAEYTRAKRPQNIYELMGLELNDEEKQAISTSTSYAMDAINSLMQLEQAWADKAVENAQRRVDATRNALQIEKEARANGYANNVEYAQKEYEAAKKQQERALKQRRKLQQAQMAIDAATQVTNLVTGTTEIWKVYAAQPWIAASLTALMWSSFAASKIMAMQAVKAQNEKEEYAEGTVELLQGGSHASGNDVDLGVKPNGVRRRAEGGEYFAVINRRNSRKYRHQIPDIINALNRGDFDKRYLTAEQASAEVGKYVAAYDKAGGITLKYERSATDLRRLEDDVRKLREQGERHTAIDNKGRVIEQYKNVRRITNI